MQPLAQTLSVIITDVAVIAINGPKYLMLRGALWLAKRKYCRRVKSWN